MGLTTATNAMIPACSFLLVLLLHAPLISQALAPSSRGSANRFPLKLTLQQEGHVLGNKEQSLLELQEYTQKLLSPEHSVLSDFASPHAIIPVLSAWAKTESVEGAETAERIVLRLKNDDVKSVTNKHYTIVMDAWGKAGHVDKAAVLFEEMISIGTDNPAVAPNRVSHNVLMSAHGKVGNVQKAAAILVRMETNEDVQPITFDYNILLGAYARSGRAGEAEKLMQRMVGRCKEKEKEKGVDRYCDCAPDNISYNLLLDAHAKSGEANAGKRGLDILSAWNRQYEEGEISFLPDTRSYTAVIQAVVRSYPTEEAIAKAKGIMKECQSRGIEKDIYLQVALMDSYANSRDVNAANEAEKLLDVLEEDGISNDIAYNTVLKVWKGSSHPDAPARATALMKRMEDRKIANTISYTTLVGVLANKGDTASAKRANEILEHMQKSYEEGNVSIKPNSQTYNSVINAWQRCGDVDRAEQLLRQLEELYKDGGGDLAPNVVSYSTVMNGYTRSQDDDAIQKTEEIFRRMQAAYEAGNEAARPNMHSYVTLINAYRKSSDPDAALKAEQALFQLYGEYKKGNDDLKPNYQLVTTVIDCWQRSGKGDAGEKAEALLDWMITQYQEDRDEDLEPNEYTFTSTISAWSKSRRLGKASRARSILQRMIDLYEDGTLSACPNEHCYTAVINSCAYCERDAAEKRTSLEIAIFTYKELVKSKYGNPNEVTFATFLTALRNLLPPSKGRSAAVRSVFETASNDGRVNNLVLRRVQSALTSKELHEMFPDAISEHGEVQLNQLPNEWRRNVNSSPRRVQKSPFGQRT